MPVAAPVPDKFQRYRERMKARGLKQVRLWVPDLDAPGAREELAEEIAQINAASRNNGIMDFLDAANAELEAMIVAEEAGRSAPHPLG